MTNLKEMIDKEFTFEPYDFEKSEVSGIPLHTKHLPFAPCVHIRILFHYGAMHDEIGKEGVAHFLEHMIFKGNDIYPDEKSIKNFSKDILLNTHNAHTGLFELVIEGKCLPHNFEKAIQGIFAMTHSPKLTVEGWEQEKKIIMQEAWSRFLNEKYIAYVKKFRDNRLANLPDRRRIISALGWPDTITKITHEDITSAHKKYFVKENMEILLAGNIEALGIIENIKNIISETADRIPNGEKTTPPFIPTEVDLPEIQRMDHTFSDIGVTEKNQANVSISYSFARINKKPGIPNTSEENLLIATSFIVQRLVSDVIYEKLRTDNNWCYSANANFYIETDFLKFNMGTSINPDHIDEAIEIAQEILEDIKKGQYEEKFEQRKRLVIEATLASEHSSSGVIDAALDDIMIVSEIVKERTVLDEFEQVQFDDVKKMIGTYLIPERAVIEILRPIMVDKSPQA
ncbi:MAG: pitrilysin family protein [Patescibacteria group bacterium]